MHESRPLVSIVVPVWNGAASLERCLSSLVSQTLSSLEVVVIDDGSTDGTPGIIERFASLHPGTFVAVRTRNQGLGAARNEGLDRVQGELIGFVDADDWVHPWAFERMAEALGAADLVVTNFEVVDPRGARVVDVLSRLSEDPLLLTLPAVWNKLYRRPSFERVRFPRARLAEDFATTPRLMLSAKRVATLSDSPYVYERSGGGGLTARMARDPELAFEYVTAFETLCTHFSADPRSADFQTSIEYGLLSQMAAACSALSHDPPRRAELVNRAGRAIQALYPRIFDVDCPFPEWPSEWRPPAS